MDKYDYKGNNLIVCVQGFNDFDLGGSGFYFQCTESSNGVSRYISSPYHVDMNNLDNTIGTFRNLRPNIIFYFDVHGTGSLQGEVSMENGAAVPNARITVEGLYSVQQTDTKGLYNFPYLREGTQNVTFSALGFEDVNKTVSISDGQSTTLNVTMSNRPIVKISGVIAGSDNPGVGS